MAVDFVKQNLTPLHNSALNGSLRELCAWQLPCAVATAIFAVIDCDKLRNLSLKWRNEK